MNRAQVKFTPVISPAKAKKQQEKGKASSPESKLRESQSPLFTRTARNDNLQLAMFVGKIGSQQD